MEPVLGSATLANQAGMHARPAVKIAKAAKSFNAEISLRIDENTGWISAKSTNSLMKLKGRTGDVLHFRAQGEDAPKAISTLIGMVEDKFGED